MAGSFASQIERFNTKTTRRADQLVRYVCLNLMRDCIMGTPVDTGRARGNWQASIGSPALGTLEREDKGGQAAVADGMGAVSEATGRVFYLTNNLPYIYPLEFEGHSSQAPAGWVRASVERAKLIVTRLEGV